MVSLVRVKSYIFVAVSLLLIAGCGGGGGGSNPQPPIVGSDPVWTAGVFEAETNFKNICQAPRTGIDPNTGNAFPDRQGSTLFENHWLRSWSNNTYLWFDEIADSDPSLTPTTAEYFDLLKSDATTPSGNPRDQFHFTFDTEVWQQLTQSGVSAGYGAEWAVIAASPPRDIRIAFIEPNSPASTENLARGAEVLEVDGIDVVNGSGQENVDALNAGLFPSDEGESHSFTLRDIGSNETRTVTMVSGAITSTPVQNVTTIDTANGKVGYMLFNSHIQTAEEGLINAFTQLSQAGVNDLVLDLRYNGGGLLAIASQLAYMVAGPTATSGKAFDTLVFNDKHPITNPITGAALGPTPFFDESLGFSVDAGQQLPALNLDRVFILSTGRTCSASEAIINGLRGADIEVILIGSTTCGKPYGFFPADNCGTTYFTIQFKGENDKGFSDYADGFSPVNTLGTVGELVTGCSVGDDFLHQLGDPLEGQLAAALLYRETDSCPAPTGKAVSNFARKAGLQEDSLIDSDFFRRRTLVLENQIIEPLD